jgi:hypothetical protein
MGDPYQRLRGQPVVIHLLSGRTIAGTIYASWRGVVELRGAMELDAGRLVGLDGATCTPFHSIDYFQVVDVLPGEQPTAQMRAVSQ